ncbi:hypothetical protein H4S08_004649 [Coemansia sp. RSA 1365]|nr:hypothetical protein H4S08_004649 [Coemansia sp. RSA 1365]
MTVGGGFQNNSANRPGSELIHDLIAYYSSAECATKATATGGGLTRMHPDKAYESSAQSTDTEHTGTRSSESASSSLGDSAAAAARVLAAWQDRTGAAPGDAATAAVAAATAGSLPASIAENPALWSMAATHRNNSASHTSQPAINSGRHDDSVPVSSSHDDTQRRPDMGFLELLNSAAAYVAESSDGHASNSKQQVAGTYAGHEDLFSGSSLSLPVMSSGYDRTGTGSGPIKYGVGAWKKILDDPSFAFNSRTSVDLKDRFRTIRAQECAHSPYAKTNRKSNGKVPDVVWPLPPGSQRLQGLHRVQRKPTRNYTSDEDRRLLLGVLRHANHWTKIAADPDLKLGNRPGQSLRDRLRNAFPEVFEMFGYVIPKKERADRERFATPSATGNSSDRTVTSKRKAPTGSKRMDGAIPEPIKDKIMSVLSAMNASLDPNPLPCADDADVASPAQMSDDDQPSTARRGSVADSHSAEGTSPEAHNNKSRRRSSTQRTPTTKMSRDKTHSVVGRADSGAYEAFSPSAFLRQMGTMTPTDQLDALALEGRACATPPTLPSKRRHSVQADINDALAAATAAAGLDRSNIASALGFFHPAISDLDHSGVAAAAAGASMQLGSSDAMRRMTVAGPGAADPYLFPRLPEEDTTHTVESSGSAHHAGGALRLAAEPVSAGAYESDRATPRGQRRTVQRLMRHSGVADDSGIGLSTTPGGGDGRMELDAMAQFSQWFPGLSWGLGASASTTTGAGESHMCSESIDPNMLNVGLGGAAPQDPAHDANSTHMRRRSQFDWYGLTPSLAAALDAAGTTAAAVAAQAVADSSGLAPLTIAGSQATCRRPSMPVFPSFACTPGGELQAMQMPAVNNTESAAYSTVHNTKPLAEQPAEPAAYSAAAAAAAVAVALSEGSDSLNMHATAPRSYSLGSGAATAKAASLAQQPSSAQHGRRRTMHVPPSLIEGVASSEFSDSLAPEPRPAFVRPPRPLDPHALHRQFPQPQDVSASLHFPQLVGGPALQLHDGSAAATSATASSVARHARTYSDTQLRRGALGGFPELPGLLDGGDNGAFSLSAVGLAASQPGAGASGVASMDIDLDAMASLSANAGAFDLSFKPSLWSADDAASQLSIHDESRSLFDSRADLSDAVTGLYRPASSTPTGHRHLGIGASTRHASPSVVAQSASAISPVAPRSTASTPGRREAVGS